MSKELEETLKLEMALKNIKTRCHSKSMKYDPIDFDLDIVEQELQNLDLIKRALVEGIWSTEYWYCEREENKDKLKHIHPSFDYLDGEFGFNCGDNCYYFVYLKDYMKTWWFKENKEE